MPPLRMCNGQSHPYCINFICVEKPSEYKGLSSNLMTSKSRKDTKYYITKSGLEPNRNCVGQFRGIIPRMYIDDLLCQRDDGVT